MVELEIVLDHTEHSLLEVKLSQIYQKQLFFFFFMLHNGSCYVLYKHLSIIKLCLIQEDWNELQ